MCLSSGRMRVRVGVEGDPCLDRIGVVDEFQTKAKPSGERADFGETKSSLPSESLPVEKVPGLGCERSGRLGGSGRMSKVSSTEESQRREYNQGSGRRGELGSERPFLATPRKLIDDSYIPTHADQEFWIRPQR